MPNYGALPKLMKTTLINQAKQREVRVWRISMLTRLTALIMLALSLSLAAKADNSSQLSPRADPNAIVITSQDIQSLMTGNDPYGILNFLALQTGLTFRSTAGLPRCP